MWSSTRCATDWSCIAVFMTAVLDWMPSSIGRLARKTKETGRAWDELRSPVGQLRRKPALEDAQRLVALLLRSMHQPVRAGGVALRHRPAQPPRDLALRKKRHQAESDARPPLGELGGRFETVHPDGLLRLYQPCAGLAQPFGPSERKRRHVNHRRASDVRRPPELEPSDQSGSSDRRGVEGHKVLDQQPR